MVLSASAPSALAETGNSYTYFTSQLQFAALGLAIMWGCIKNRLSFIFKILQDNIYFLSFNLTFSTDSGHRPQKVEVQQDGYILDSLVSNHQKLLRVGLIIGLAGYLTEYKDELRSFVKGFIIPLAMVGVPVLIALFIQNHLSVGIVMTLITFVMMIVAGCRLLYFIASGAIVRRNRRNSFSRILSYCWRSSIRIEL